MGGRLRNIQALRGIAALMVFAIHSIAAPRNLGLDWLAYPLFSIAPAGVDLFFVISGLVITIAALDLREPESWADRFTAALRFALKRAIRIYPLYWIAFALAVAMSPYVYLAPDFVPSVALWKQFLLLTTNNNKVMLAWTLAYEIYFYFAISVIVLLVPGHIFRGIAIWACLSFSLLGYATITGNGWTQYVFASPLIIEFTIGAAIAYLVRRRIFIHPWLSVAAGVIGFAIGSRFNTDWAVWSRTLCFAAPAGLIVYGFVALEIGCRRVMPVVLQRLGDASYSIYLWHQLLFFAIFAIFDHLGWIDGIPGGILVICWIMAVFPTTLLIHRFVEAPTLEFLNRALFSRTDRSTSERGVAGENPIIPSVFVPARPYLRKWE